MRRGGFGALFALTVAVLVLGGPGGSSTATPAHRPAAVSEAAAKAQQAMAIRRGSPALERGFCNLQGSEYISCGDCDGFCPADDLKDLVRGFFVQSDRPEIVPENCPGKLPKVPKADMNAAASDADLKAHWDVPFELRRTVRFVIAMVPDPAHTHLSLQTDRILESIMQGAQGSGYLFSRAYLPWDPAKHPESDDYLTRLNESSWQTDREGLPGLLIFRKAQPNNICEAARPLFVFIVGERPTGGIDKRQFQSALRIMAAIRDENKDNVSKEPLRILGPNFSGSLYSLDYLLDHDPIDLDPPARERPVIIDSGGVSSFDTISWFMKSRNDAKRQVDFRTFVESNQYQLARFLAYAVCERHYQPNDVVLLAEDETAYGNFHPETPLNRAKSDFNDCRARLADVPTVFFPRDISHLRSAYQQQTQVASAADTGTKAPRTTLPLNMEDAGSDDDTVPTYSPGQTPLSEEATLLGIISSLHKQHAKFVIVVATNPLDEIFLSQYLTRVYPEVRIVTFDEDLLLSREVDDPRFTGILSVTTYPLFPETADAVAFPVGTLPGSAQHHDFASDASVGTYNAAVSLFAEKQTPSCVHSPNMAAPAAANPCNDLPANLLLAEYGWPALAGNGREDRQAQERLIPPLTLTVIGNDGFWPVAILDGDRYKHFGGAPGSFLHAIDSASQQAANSQMKLKPWEMLCSLFIVATIIYLFLRWKGSILTSTRIAANFAPVNNSYCNYGLFVADVTLVSILGLLMSPWFSSSFPIADLPLAATLFAALAALWIGSVWDLHRRRNDKLAGVSLAWSILFLLIVYLRLDHGPAASVNLFFYRFVHITSGVSPLAPFLVLALSGLWWAWHTLAGLVLSDDRGPKLPKETEFKLPEKAAVGSEATAQPPDGPAANSISMQELRFSALSQDGNRILLRVIHPGDPDYRVLLLPVLGLIMALFLIDYSHPVRGLEGRGYDWTYAFVFCFVLFVLLCDLFRIVVVWIELRRPLSTLNRLTLRRAFPRQEEIVGKPIWRLGSSAFDDFFPLLGRQLDSLRELKKFLEAGQPLHQAISTVEVAAKDLAENVGQYRQAQRKVSPAGPGRFISFFLSGEEPSGTTILEYLSVFQTQLASACAKAILYLDERWKLETQAHGALPEDAEPTKELQCVKEVLPDSTTIAEDFVCLFYFNFISSIFLRLRALLVSTAGLFVFLVLSFNCYPFQPKSVYHTVMVFVFVLIVALVGVVMGQMHRDPTISHITNTQPGELGWDFWFRMASFIALPLLTLLTSQFPEFGNFLFSWAQPALNNLK